MPSAGNIFLRALLGAVSGGTKGAGEQLKSQREYAIKMLEGRPSLSKTMDYLTNLPYQSEVAPDYRGPTRESATAVHTAGLLQQFPGGGLVRYQAPTQPSQTEIERQQFNVLEQKRLKGKMKQSEIIEHKSLNPKYGPDFESELFGPEYPEPID